MYIFKMFKSIYFSLDMPMLTKLYTISDITFFPSHCHLKTCSLMTDQRRERVDVEVADSVAAVVDPVAAVVDVEVAAEVEEDPVVAAGHVVDHQEDKSNLILLLISVLLCNYLNLTKTSLCDWATYCFV